MDERTRRRRLREVAEETFGWDRLRPGQREAMQELLDGHDVLLVSPTGSGKSAVYQVPGQLLPGPTVVVSPLIALQRDQVAGLRDVAAGGAVAVNSTQPEAERAESLDRAASGDAEYVFLSPEQLAKPEVLDRLAAARPSLIAVDEAHCVSSWGYDFRPDYLGLGRAIERLGHPPVAALTATAAPPVRDDIVRALGLRDARQIVRGFDRPNLWLEVRRFLDDEDKRQAIIADAAGRKGLGLIYVATRRDAAWYAERLREAGRRAEPYHGAMRAAERRRVHGLFRDDEVDVVVATSAFGMGIDKPDVRYVLHAAPPESPDAYYQEIGRAGRDGDPAAAVLFYRPEDLGLRRFFTGGRADEEILGRVAVLVHAHGGTVERGELQKTLDISAARLTKAVNLLAQAGALDVTGKGAVRYASGGPDPERAVAAAVELDEGRRRIDRSRLEMMRAYAEHTGCRRRFLLEYFGEPYEQACGNCDVDLAGDGAEEEDPGEGPFRLHAGVVHAEWGEGVVMRREPDRITVLFDEVGYKTLSLEAVEHEGLLTLRG
ncbi:RecQ family ATP-dependent DNA helicase [Thermomonospora cellulosilytica]|uniref:ATP-dependent DNA helicase RecQ n=1 Tax=Thermomonospora cellulosilytica TaxID=1411118 RepID=A0A7W3N281_9ACTN|nr:RecQ family ATP-dependent DNA helicase [Thermomonospora cellulosilytica]MBA9006205.1 ATP-dependent DNA helicase RecQ [Thermomonospora cellulosilytica]